MVEPIHVDEKLAVSPMPSEGEVPRLAREYRLVVVLADEYELGYDVGLWYDYDAEVIHIPVPDLRAPPIPSVYAALERVVGFRGKVLVHCVGGRGRSGAFAAAYLVRRYGLGAREAIEAVRRVVPGAIETRAQELFPHVYRRVLEALGVDEMSAVRRLGERYDWGRGEMHASYVAMHSVRLYEQLGGLLGLGVEALKPLLVGSLLHDIGLARGEPHNEHSYDLILGSQVLDVLGDEVKKLAALVALHHRGRVDPRRDPRSGDAGDLVARLAAIVKLADALDRSLMQVVEDVEVIVEDGEVRLVLSCLGDCDAELERAVEKAWLLEDLLGRPVVVERG